MSDATANLALPYLAPAQAQKHVTVNDALRRLDAVVQLSVVSATTTAQPGSPVDGAVYILPAGKTGAAWGAMANEALAYYRDGAWEAITPKEGWIAFVKDTDQLRVFDGAAWTQTAARAGLGLGTAAVKNTGASGDAVPLLNVSQTWSATQSFAGNVVGVIFGSGGRIADQVTPRRTLFYCGGDRLDFVSENGGTGLISLTAAGMTFGSSFHSFFHAGMSPRPAADNTHSLGDGSLRWSTVYAATGAINTSDAREKSSLAPIPDAVKRAARRVIAGVGMFQWLEAIERKGADRARLHVGVTAQAVRDAFLAEGEDPARWALFCEDAVTERVEVAPARVETVTITDPETGEERVVRTPIPARFEERPKLDAHGAPVTRLGVRVDQLMWLAVAAAT